MAEVKTADVKTTAAHHQKAIFAGGCYWCMQPPFDNTPGVLSTVVGYCGGKEENPTYEQISSGRTGHAEAIEITFDPKKVSYESLLDIFWRNVDPTSRDAQFVDVGRQYRTAIFYLNEEQKRLAEASKLALEKEQRFDRPIVTEISAATTFYEEKEDYHQKYYQKSPTRYKIYRFNSGRDAFIEKTWKNKKK